MKTTELNKLKEDLDVLKEKCELFLRQATASPSVSKLSSELTVLLQSMSQVYSMSSIYMDKYDKPTLSHPHGVERTCTDDTCFVCQTEDGEFGGQAQPECRGAC